MTFDYPEYLVAPTPADPERTSLHRPVIRVRMIGPKDSGAFWTLLDTGADESYITESVAKKLGVTPVSNERGTILSASGEMHVWYGELSIEVTDGNESYELSIVAGVVPQDWSEMILGHLGFFEYFDAVFSDTDRTVTLVARG